MKCGESCHRGLFWFLVLRHEVRVPRTTHPQRSFSWGTQNSSYGCTHDHGLIQQTVQKAQSLGAGVCETRAGGDQTPVFNSLHPAGSCRMCGNPSRELRQPVCSARQGGASHGRPLPGRFQSPRFLEEGQVPSTHSCLYKQSRHSEPLSSGTGGNAPKPSSQCQPRAAGGPLYDTASGPFCTGPWAGRDLAILQPIFSLHMRKQT